MSTITGTINIGITIGTSGSYASPLTVAAGGYVHNTGTGDAIYGPNTGPWAVVNYGRVIAQTGGGAGIEMGAGGSVANHGGGLIAGRIGVDIVGGGGTVTNYGTINGAGLADGVYLGRGGTVVNGGLIKGTYNGVLVERSAGTVMNYGTILGADLNGVALSAGGIVINNSGGFISGQIGVRIETGGSVVNFGTIEGSVGAAGIWISQIGNNTITNNSGGFISGRDGVEIVVSASTLINAGTIVGATHMVSVAGVYIGDGGNVFNNSGGLITGEYGVLINCELVDRFKGVVVNGGTIVGSGGLASIDIKQGSGTVTNNSGGLVIGAGADGIDITGSAGTVINGGTITATGVGIALAAGGTVTASGTVVGGGTAIAFGGTSDNRLVLEPGYHLTGSVIGSTAAGATDTMELDGQAGSPLTVSYNGLGLVNFEAVAFGSGGYSTLDITNTAGMPGVVFSGFTLTNETIDLTAIGTDGTISNTDTVNHRVTITGSLGAVTLQLDATDSDLLATSSDGLTGTNVSPVCFLRGTLILTERGEVPVEDLRVGDRVQTLSGTLNPIIWIGLGRSLVTRANKLARPIIVHAGALADNVPTRDLYLTHGHALYLDGVLIPVENLVNHRSIEWDETSRVVEYYHLELADHEVLLANGAPAESYYDASNRALFHITRPGSEEGNAKPTFAPVLNGGEVVEQAWRKLLDRAGGRVLATADTTDDPDVHLMVAGRRLDAAMVEEGTYSFALPAPPDGTLRLCSRAGVPSLLGITPHDHRRLGIAIRRIEISQRGMITSIDPEASLMVTGGCHQAEQGYCWTDGNLTLPGYLFEHLMGGALTLTVHTERPGDMRYPCEEDSGCGMEVVRRA